VSVQSASVGRVAARLLGRPEFGAIAGALLVWVFFATIAWDNNFVSWDTTAAILNRAAPLGVLAAAVSLLMIGGEFDLSIGSVVGFSGMTIMVAVTAVDAGGFGFGLGPALLLAVAVASVIGLINGALVVRTRLPSFIITLATLFIVRGLTIALARLRTGRTQLGGLDDVAGFDVAHMLFATPLDVFGASLRVSVLWWIAATALAAWVQIGRAHV